jgi:hypothetical protein
MVVWFTTTYAISCYHHWFCEFESRSGRGVKHYVIKFVSDLRQVGGFLLVIRSVSYTSKTYLRDITEIWLKVELNTIKTNKQTLLYTQRIYVCMFPATCFIHLAFMQTAHLHVFTIMCYSKYIHIPKYATTMYNDKWHAWKRHWQIIQVYDRYISLLYVITFI